MKFILMDVEGTTTSISFVHDVLFPYSRKLLKEYVLKNAALPEVASAISLTKETVKEENQKFINSTEEVCDQLLEWIRIDRKHPALKSLQGDIWEFGYKSGEIKAHVYTDVPLKLKEWKDAGLDLGVYSSGSVKAQHLLFEYSIAGNLRHFFSAHFDTKVGHKREKASYDKIAAELKLEAKDILFLSDIKEELDAAREAGMNTCQLVRQNDVVIGNHQTANTFSDVKL